MFGTPAPQAYVPDPQHVQNRLEALLAQLKSARSWPWEPVIVRLHRDRNIPYLCNLLRDREEARPAGAPRLLPRCRGWKNLRRRERGVMKGTRKSGAGRTSPVTLTIGRGAFAKISAVEGVVLSDEANR